MPVDWQTGREGNYVLVNGQHQPALTINPGQSQRWRVLNATNARYLRLALTGHTLTLIGTDGGLLRAPVPGLDEILLAPAERVEVIVTASLAAGSTAVLQSLSYDRGGMGQSDKAPIPRTCKDMVEDLRQLLYAADLRPSYINDFGRVGATQYTIRSLLI